MSTKDTIDFLQPELLSEVDTDQPVHGVKHDLHVQKFYQILEDTGYHLGLDELYTEVVYGKPSQMNWKPSPPEFLPDPQKVDIEGEFDVLGINNEEKKLYYFEVKGGENGDKKAKNQLKTAKDTIEEYDVYGNYFHVDAIENFSVAHIDWYLSHSWVDLFDLYIPDYWPESYEQHLSCS